MARTYPELLAYAQRSKDAIRITREEAEILAEHFSKDMFHPDHQPAGTMILTKDVILASMLKTGGSALWFGRRIEVVNA